MEAWEGTGVFAVPLGLDSRRACACLGCMLMCSEMGLTIPLSG